MSDQHRDELSAYLDGELTEADAARLREALLDPSLAAEAEALRALKAKISTQPARVEPSAALRARVERLRHAPRRPRRWPWVLAAAAALLLCVAAWVLLPGQEGPDVLVAHHIKRTASAPELEVASSDPLVVATHFRGKVPFAPHVPTLAGADLLGGRLCSIDDQRVQLLFYARDGELTSVFVSGQTRWDRGCEDVQGHRVCYAPATHTTVIAVGPNADAISTEP